MLAFENSWNGFGPTYVLNSANLARSGTTRGASFSPSTTIRSAMSNSNSHKHQIPAKDIAEMMGHSDVPMQFVYTVGMAENKRLAAACLGKELGSLNEQLGRIGEFVPNSSEAVN